MRYSSLLRRTSVAALACLAGFGLTSHTTDASAPEWPAHVRAVFDVNFNGLNVGSFEFVSSNQGSNYDLAGLGKREVVLQDGQFVFAIGEP